MHSLIMIYFELFIGIVHLKHEVHESLNKYDSVAITKLRFMS